MADDEGNSPMRPSSLPVLLLVTAACIGPSTVDTTPAVTRLTGFGDLAGGALPTDGTPAGATFSDRHGPTTAPWRDAFSAAPALTGTLASGGNLPVREYLAGPEVVLGTKAYFAGRLGLTAYDLAAGSALWTGPAHLAPDLLVSDGAVLCGVDETKPSDVVCVNVADGSEKWRTSLPAPLTVGPGSDAEIRDGALFLMCGSTFAAFALDTGALRFTRTMTPMQRPFVFVGPWLVLDEVGSQQRFEVVDPVTGATHATRPAAYGDAFLWSLEGTAYFVLHTGVTPGAFALDASGAFTDVSASFADFFAHASAAQPLPGYLLPHGLTDVRADGTVLGMLEGFSGTGTTYLCAWNAKTKTSQWCQPFSSAKAVRLHPNALFVVEGYYGQPRPVVLTPEGGAPSTVPFHWFFSDFAFDGQGYEKLH
jgi:hypothetical protein